ncbi:MAG: hypothetical protein F6J96_12675 [Symploca sp. SIO1C2]|nr:hypothetical protein [Symploca sp. SIO1C2]
MKQQLEQRLTELKAEFTSGQQVLADLEAKQANVRTTLLRIQGAMQVIEEELAKTEEDNHKSVERIIEPELIANS